MKAGYKTTEFWVVVVGIAGVIWLFIQQKCAFEPTDVITIASMVVAYVMQRGWVKTRTDKE